jgi:hypothetical protein
MYDEDFFLSDRVSRNWRSARHVLHALARFDLHSIDYVPMDDERSCKLSCDRRIYCAGQKPLRHEAGITSEFTSVLIQLVVLCHPIIRAMYLGSFVVVNHVEARWSMLTMRQATIESKLTGNPRSSGGSGLFLGAQPAGAHRMYNLHNRTEQTGPLQRPTASLHTE